MQDIGKVSVPTFHRLAVQRKIMSRARDVTQESRGQDLKRVQVVGGTFRPGKFTAVLLLILGFVLAFLGYEEKFTLIGCGPGWISCIRVSLWNFVAIFTGLVAMGIGAFVLIRQPLRPHP